MLKKLNISILVAFFVILAVNQVFACSCRGPRSYKPFQPCSIYWNAEVIFIGKVNKITYDKATYKGKRYKSKIFAHLSVDKAVRGVKNGETIVIETSASSCGFPFKEGEDYFVYQNRRSDGTFKQHLCGATVNLKNAKADLEYLKAIENGEIGSRIYGNIRRYGGSSVKNYGANIPLFSIKVTLRSVRPKKKYLYSTGLKKSEIPKYKKLQLTTYTNDKGYYLFKDIPPGFYEVNADTPIELRLFNWGNSLGYGFHQRNYFFIDKVKRRCGIRNIFVTSLPNISGKVIDENGKMPPQQYLSLVPIDENGQANFNSKIFNGSTYETNGKFLFHRVPPGKYLLAINPKDCPAKRYKGFGKVFYPGVREQSDAQIITVNEYVDLKLEDFQLLPKLPERKISGFVLDENGKPFHKSRVLLWSGNSDKCNKYSSQSEFFTDEKGKFIFKANKGYKYKILASNWRKGNKRLESKLTDISSEGNVENLELKLSKPR